MIVHVVVHGAIFVGRAIRIDLNALTGSLPPELRLLLSAAANQTLVSGGVGAGLLPAAALVDFELTLSKPTRLTADSGLDALCHALEAYVSRKATPFTDTLALSACRTITRHLRTACDEPYDRAAREALALASTQAGIAFSNASVTLIHGMSRPIGARFHVPHGLSNAILLPTVTAYSLPGAHERYADVARAIGYADGSERDASACTKLVGACRHSTAFV